MPKSTSSAAAPTQQPAAPNHAGQATALANQFNHLLSTDAFTGADYFYTANLTSLNGSGVTGTAVVGYDVDTHSLTVSIEAAGLEPNQVHIQHIHGFTDGADAAIPTLANDTDGDGFVELAEGAAVYGGILLNLSTDHTNGTGGDNGHSHDGALSGFPTAPDGTIHFLETYSVAADSPLALFDLTNDHIVIHGETVAAGVGAGTPGEVDGTAGYKLVLPVAIGEIEEVTSVRAFKSAYGAGANEHHLDIMGAAGPMHHDWHSFA